MTVDEKLDIIIREMSNMRQDISDVKQDISDAKQDITSIKLDIENSIKPSIQIIAEGHMNLDRKLNEVIKTTYDIQSKFESYDLKMISHDSEINKLKVIK